MARGKFADRVANRLGDHAVGHHIRGKKMTEVVLSAIFALGILALVAVWAAATAGYESRSVFSPNWNLTDNDHWYSKFIPPTPGPLCQPAFINTGSTFRTNNGIFLWEMGKGFNVSSSLINGNNSTMANFNATVLSQYSDETLDHCDVSGVSIDMDLLQATVVVQIYATCIDPKWPALLHTRNVYSMDSARLQEDALWFDQIITPDPENNASIPDAMNDLAEDLWNRMKAVYLRSSNVLPTVRGLRMVNGNNCALVNSTNKQACFDQPLKLSNNSNGFYLYPNLTITTQPFRDEQVDWNVTTDNFINAVFAAARYDFGSNMTNNLFYNLTARQQLITGSDSRQLDNDSAIMNFLDGATTFLETPVFPPAKLARIRTSYMCNVMKIKQTPAFVVSVLGLAFAIFGVVFAAAVAVVKKVTGKDFGASVPGPIAALSPITSITSAAPDSSGAKAEGEQTVRRRRRDPEKGRSLSAGSSGDFRLDSPRLDSRTNTPAPSYHLNARATDAVYTPLNDRSSEAGGSGAVTPSALAGTKVNSFSSLTGLARGFTDKLPFGSQIADKISGLPGKSDLSLPKNAAAAGSRLTGSSSKWLNMATGAAAGTALGGAAAAAASHVSGKTGLSVPEVPTDMTKAAEEGQAMFTRPAQAAQYQQLYHPNPPSEYVPFAYPESIREGGTTDPTPTPEQQAAGAASAAQVGQNAFGQQPAQHPFLAPAALAGAGVLAAGGVAAAGYVAGSSGQSTSAAAPSQQMTTAPSAITAIPPPPSSSYPARVTSPGPPAGHTSSVPSHVTSPGPPMGARSVGAPARVTSPGPPVGHSSSVPSRVTSPGPPVGARSVGAPARVTSPGPPVGHSASVPSRVTSPGPPVGLRSAATPAAAAAVGATTAAVTTSIVQPTPKILAPQPRRAPSPTWLAEQEAAAAAAAQSAAAPAVAAGTAAAATTATVVGTASSTIPDTPVVSSNPVTNIAAAGQPTSASASTTALMTQTSESVIHSPLSQIQRSLNSTFSNARSTIGATAQNTVAGGLAQAQSAAHSASQSVSGTADAAAQAFASKNPFSK